ncbi:MAG TPA: IS256 family transposase [Geminicoccaceae bacterium]
MAEVSLPSLEWLRKQLQEADPDLLRAMVESVVATLMGADADALCGAAYGERHPERTNRRNGYRERAWDTRLGTIALPIPKLRHGSYFPEWLLEPRRRAERALVQVVAEAYLLGVSVRRVESLVQTLGIDRLSKSRVAEMARELDALVATFRTRPLDAGPYAYLWIDAQTQRCRDGGRVVNVATVTAIGVNAEGYREVLGCDVITTEDGAGWTAFLRDLVARGLSGVRLVVSDDHKGLKQAVAAVLTGASWQRCRTHFARNLLSRVPRSAQPLVATLVRSIFAQPSAAEVWAQHGRVVEQLQDRFAAAADLLLAAAEDILAFAAFPSEHWRQIWSNNPLERLHREIRRRTDVVGIFPNRGAVIRLVGAVLAEQHDDWLVTRRYMAMEGLAKALAANQEHQSQLAA